MADELEDAKAVRTGYGKAPSCTRFPREHLRCIRADNTIERLNCETQRRTHVFGTFLDGNSAFMLATVRLKCVAKSE